MSAGVQRALFLPALRHGLAGLFVSETRRAMTLDEIDALVADHRRLYLAALWAGHEGEAECHTMEVDRLLSDRWTLQQESTATGLT